HFYRTGIPDVDPALVRHCYLGGGGELVGRTALAAPFSQEIAVNVEFFDAVITFINDVKIILGVERNFTDAKPLGKLTVSVALAAKGKEGFALAVVFGNNRITAVTDIKVILGVNRQTLDLFVAGIAKEDKTGENQK